MGPPMRIKDKVRSARNPSDNMPIPDEVEFPTAKIGMSCEVKNLYQGKADKNKQWVWTTDFPDNVEKAAEDATTAEFAILVRNKKVFGDSRKSMMIDSILIQSPLIKKSLAVILKDYPGVTTSLGRLIFEADFRPFVHRWNEFTQVLKDEEDKETKAHLSLLYDTLANELKETLDAVNDFITKKIVTYEHLWTLFPPGCEVFTTQYGRECCMRVMTYSYGVDIIDSHFSLQCLQVDWDGQKFGTMGQTLRTYSFEGTLPIEQLSSFPLSFHSEVSDVVARLEERGRKFEKLQGSHYRMHIGNALMKNSSGFAMVQTDSRAVIDAQSYFKFNAKRSPLQDLQPAHWQEDDPADDYMMGADVESIDGETDIVTGRALPSMRLNRMQLRMCSPLVKGYALRTKRWLEFMVDSLHDIEFSNTAFESLVMPDDQKDLVLAFAESQLEFRDRFDDVIEGKGKGIILLLKGPPGTGKTLTAESVSETMRVPLYSLAASDLGLNSDTVEAALTNILEMVGKWNAVLLLDECDVFLEARDSNNLERNKLVSIFLRTLEYYEGILFLTTNRVTNMDAAFQSRIHVSIEYPELNEASRRHIWKGFLDRGIDNELTSDQLDALAEIDLNGRQIKNMLKTSQLLAFRKRMPLQFAHIKTVLNIEKKGRVLA